MLKWIKKKILNNKYFLRPLRDPSKFEFFQSKGIHVMENHFYNPVPDTTKLDKKFFDHHYNWEGIDVNDAEQVSLLETFIRQYKSEYSQFPVEKPSVEYQYYWSNLGFQCLDAVSLYGMIRHFKPKQIIEIGGGNTTMISAHATLKNAAEGHPCNFTSIEPYPLEILKKGFPGLNKLIVSEAQLLPIETFLSLKENDILFIDTSHIVKLGGELIYYFMELIPRIGKGVIIHFHDIFLPEEYPKEWVMKRHLFFTEQYFLRAFLSYNDSFKITFAGRYLQLAHPELANKAYDFYPKEITKAGSFWIQRIK